MTASNKGIQNTNHHKASAVVLMVIINPEAEYRCFAHDWTEGRHRLLEGPRLGKVTKPKCS